MINFGASSGKVETFGATSIVKSFASPPAAGDFVAVVVFGHSTIAFSAGEVTDNQGNTYTLAEQDTNAASPAVGLYFCANIGPVSGTFTITYTPPSATNCWMAAGFWTGMGAATIMETLGGNGSSTTPATGSTPSVTPGAGGALVIAAAAILAANTSMTVDVVSPAYTELEQVLGTPGGLDVFKPPGEIDWRVITTPGVQSCSWVSDVAGGWSTVIVVFAAVASVPRDDSTPCCGGGGDGTGDALPDDPTRPLQPWIPACAGGGSVESAADLIDAESWA